MDSQRKMARSALGLPNNGKRSYRNRYTVPRDTPAWQDWLDMCGEGLAEITLRSTMDHFALTPEGARLALEPGESLDPEDFPS